MLTLLALAALGLALLTVAADHLVLGAGRLAARFGISPVVVGVVVIGLGTSAPELVVSGIASVRGDGGLAVANLVGSNVLNVTVILGIAALFAALVLVGLGRLAGALLGAALILTVVILVRLAHVTTADPLPAEVGDFLDAPPVPRAGREALRAVLGLAGTLLGAHLLVANAATAAQRLGVPQTVVGFTLVAVGTSLPELVTAVQAQRRGDADLLVGNLLGSNLFNAVAGGAVVGLMGRGEPARLGYPVLAAMVAVSLLTWLVLYRGYRVSRFEAVLLLVAYALTLPLIT